MGQTTTPSSEPVPTAAEAEQAEHGDPSAPLVFYGTENRPTKKAKTERAPKPPKPAGVKTKPEGESRQPRKKRGPARPHRRLDIDTINLRRAKLEKRRLRAKEQLEDATRHVEGYRAEREFRDQEAAGEAKA
jgi:hypothetical protein